MGSGFGSGHLVNNGSAARCTPQIACFVSCGGSSPPGPCLPLPLIRRSYHVKTLARSASRISGDSMVFVSLFPPASSSSVLPYAALPPSHRPSESKSTTSSLRWMAMR
ncbi:unnamed protein product [Musa textilis]